MDALFRRTLFFVGWLVCLFFPKRTKIIFSQNVHKIYTYFSFFSITLLSISYFSEEQNVGLMSKSGVILSSKCFILFETKKSAATVGDVARGHVMAVVAGSPFIQMFFFHNDSNVIVSL